MVKCQNCNTELWPNMKKCYNCGTEYKEENSVPEGEPATREEVGETDTLKINVVGEDAENPEAVEVKNESQPEE